MGVWRALLGDFLQVQKFCPCPDAMSRLSQGFFFGWTGAEGTSEQTITAQRRVCLCAENRTGELKGEGVAVRARGPRT